MKLAFVHCWIFPGWALNVLKDLIIEEKLTHPDSEIKIFTLISDSDQLIINGESIKIVTALPSRLNKLFLYFTNHKTPIFSSLFDYRNLIVFYPFWIKRLSKKIQRYIPHKISISSFAIAKNIDQKNIKTSLYLHSPMQYIRSHNDEYTEKLKGRRGKLFKRITPRLKKWDMKFTKFDEVYANSKYTAELAKKIYGINATVKYPKVSMDSWLVTHNSLPYYIFMGRIVNFVKETDKIIQLFNQSKDPLLIVGNWPDEIYLKSIANNNIIFIDRIKDEKAKLDILKNAKWFINLTKESFWISTVEALLLGVPVFGYNQWATPELVDKDSWILVDKKDIHTLITKFDEFKNKQRDKETIIKNITKKLV